MYLITVHAKQIVDAYFLWSVCNISLNTRACKSILYDKPFKDSFIKA